LRLATIFRELKSKIASAPPKDTQHQIRTLAQVAWGHVRAGARDVTAKQQQPVCSLMMMAKPQKKRKGNAKVSLTKSDSYLPIRTKNG